MSVSKLEAKYILAGNSDLLNALFKERDNLQATVNALSKTCGRLQREVLDEAEKVRGLNKVCREMQVLCDEQRGQLNRARTALVAVTDLTVIKLDDRAKCIAEEALNGGPL